MLHSLNIFVSNLVFLAPVVIIYLRQVTVKRKALSSQLCNDSAPCHFKTICLHPSNSLHKRIPDFILIRVINTFNCFRITRTNNKFKLLPLWKLRSKRISRINIIAYLRKCCMNISSKTSLH